MDRSSEALMLADPDIAKAMAEGCSLEDVQNGRRWYRRHGSRIAMLQFRYGPKATEVQAAIDEGNRIAVILTTARAAFNRIMAESPAEKPRLVLASSSSTDGPWRAVSLAVADQLVGDNDTAIGAAIMSYSGPRTKRQGWPYLRNLRRHADMKISAADRARVWRALGAGLEMRR